MQAFDIRTFAAIGRCLLAEQAPPRRTILLGSLFLLLFLNSVVTGAFLLLDCVLFPGFMRVSVRSPLFVLGNGRSGTTHMHRLLAGDAARYSYFRTYELLAPSICQRKLLRGIAAIDRVLFGSFLARRIERRFGASLEEVRKKHYWDLGAAEEDEFLFFHNFSSASLTLFFPYMRALRHAFRIDELGPARRRSHMRYYRSIVKRQIYLYGGATVHLSKNPTFMPKIQAILDVFPDAKFVYMIRNPVESISSLLDVMGGYWTAQGASPDLVADAVRELGHVQIDSYRYALRKSGEIDAASWQIVSYDDLVTDPRGVVERVYARFGLDICPDFAEFLEQEQRKASAYVSRHSYTTLGGEFAPARIREALPELFSRFRWPEPEGDAVDEEAPARMTEDRA